MPEVDTAEAPVTEIAAPTDAPQNVGVSEAARLLRSLRQPKEQPAAPVEAKAPPVEPPQPSEADPAEDSPPPQEATAETESADPQEEAPAPIEPPRSWSKEARERWAKLDPDT